MNQHRKLRVGRLAVAVAVALGAVAYGASSWLADGADAKAPAKAGTWAPKVSPWTLASLDSRPSTGGGAASQAELSLRQKVTGELVVSADGATGSVSMLRVGRDGDLYPQSARSLAPAERVTAFLGENRSVFGIQDPASELKLLGVRQDQYGYSQVSYQQMHDGVPVLGAVLRGHVSVDGRLTAVNGKFVPGINVPTQARVASSAAYQTAIGRVAEQLPSAFKNTELTARSTSLVVYRSGLTNGQKGENYLTYEVQVAGNNIREFVYVDALTGKVVDQITGVYGLKHRELYQGTYTPPVPPVWQEGQPRPDPNPTHEDEISGTGYAYNLFFNLSSAPIGNPRYGTPYRSWDGNDAPMRTVDTDPTIVCPNANWNGTTTNYCAATAADDVVGHEWTHAYTQETSGLIYSYQSGALNESYSDVFGETIDLINNRDTIGGTPGVDAANNGPRSQDDATCSDWNTETPQGDSSVRWLMGEDAASFTPLPPVGKAAIRDMWHPSCSGGTLFLGDPGHVSSPRYHCDAGDAGGVHTNSSINNRAYALLADGDTVTLKDDGTNFASPVTVTGIGLTKAAHIFWRANSVYNVPTSNFNDNANSLEMACQDLIGVNLTKLTTASEATPQLGTMGNNDTVDPIPEASGEVITAADCQQVSNAIAAVEMRLDVTKQCGFRPPLDPAPAPMCNGADVHSKLRVDWESGVPAGWTVGTRAVTNPSSFSTAPWFVRSGDLPKGRAGSAMYQEDRRDYGNCADDDESGVETLTSPVIVLDETTPSQLVFDHYFVTESNYDGGNVYISINGGAFELIPASAFVHNAYNTTLAGIADQNTNPKQGEAAFAGSNPVDGGNEWGQSQIDLVAAGASLGDSIQIRWEFGQDGCNGVDGWYVDEIEVFTCGDVTPPPTKECTSFPADVPAFPLNVFEFPLASVTTATVSGTGTEVTNVTDVNIRNLKGSHTYMGDLTFTLQSPAGTTITLFDGSACGGADGIDVNFDDDAASLIGCNDWTSGGTFRPHEALAAFNGQDANGDWTLRIEDGFPQDNGQLDGWEVQLCKVSDPVTNEEGGDEIKGSGWLLDGNGEKINFHVDAKARKGSKAQKGSKGPYKGKLQLNDKAAGVKIKVDEWTYVGPVNPECGGIPVGPNTIELRGRGELYKDVDVTVRVCAEDNGDYGYGKKSKGSKTYSTKPDRIYVECTAGCSYKTSDRGDTMIDSGNIDIVTEMMSGDDASAPADGSGGAASGSSSSGSASTVFLDPLLVDEGLIGTTQLFTVNVFGRDQLPLAGQSVSLTGVSANGVSQTVQGIAGPAGSVVFSLPVATSITEYVATSGDVKSNAVKLRPVLSIN